MRSCRTRHVLGRASASSLTIALLAWAMLVVTPGAAPAQTSLLDVVPNGRGSITVTPPSGPEDPCPGSATEAKSCQHTYAPGSQVTLYAQADATEGPSRFVGWSDERCPPTPTCVLTMDADRQSVAALFSPQRVSVWLAGVGQVTTDTPPGLSGTSQAACEILPPDPPVPPSELTEQCSGDFELFSEVVLRARESDVPVWQPLAAGSQNELPLCDQIAGATCRVIADRPRWASVGFGGVPPIADQLPPEISVRFRVLKAGDGSGTVRSQSVECGARCTVDRKFGARESLVAVPDPGSRFVRWRAACGADPSCALAVGPVTTVTAIFERVPQPSSSVSPSSERSPSSRRLSVRVLRVNVRGRGRRRAILIRLRVNESARVHARLLRGRRLVASRRWRIRAGSHLLRMRVPVRARPGAYRLRFTVTAAGQTRRMTRSVRLRR